ncbi:hypothetical protein [Thalassotalea sp. ND16A]|uniref:hypothetical protein n=1 Tax=Thalassotalea sp. ND16A TaxID=1535422 RepID=UPI00051A12FE|nr:hypothetical protein [Thalassotalea sp. ND16A]KGJ94194.1 hypothetical protein ND16A_1450 [Thalassotalea sp. ND16A]
MQQTNTQAITLTNSKLLKYTIFSFVFAAIALTTVILPAEYNIDPTGVGNKLGLTVFNNVKATATNSTSAKTAKDATETIEVVVPAGRGVEYKFTMEQYQKLTYEWITDGTALYFDLHGEPKGDTTGYFESYTITTSGEVKGSFTAPFAGSHGWFWKNTSDAPVKVQLIVNGEYIEHGLK